MEKHIKVLILIFFLALGFRLYYAFQTPTLDHEAYYNVRQISSILETGFPIYKDNLSYGGRISQFIPIYQYFLAMFNIILPLSFVLKLIPNILASTIVIINYFIAKKITKSQDASLFCAFVSAFIPIFITETFNSSSIYSLVIPLTFLSVYFLMNINKKKYIPSFLITSFILTILHPSSSLLIIGLVIYLITTNLEYLNQKREEIESILFLTFFSIWINFILYKKAFLQHGAYVIWQNTPPAILSLYFAQTNILEAVIKIGLIPLIFGIYVVYRYALREKNKDIYLLLGLALACFFLVWPKLLQPNIAFMFLGVILTILFAQGYKLFFNYLRTTKLSSHKNKFIMLFIAIFIITSVIPSVYFTNREIQNAPTVEDIWALEWLRKNIDNETIIAASLKEGHMITAIAERQNIMDSNFLLAPNTAERFKDLTTIYRSPTKTDAVSILNKHKIRYILFSNAAKSEFNIDKLGYIDRECFKLVYDSKTKIYESLCRVEEK